MSFSYLNSEYAFKQAIKSCHGVVDLCRIVSELSTKKDIKKKDSAILHEFMERSDWFTHTRTQTENGAIAVAKFFMWWATDNPNAGFWLCSYEYKDNVVAAFVTAMKGGEAKSITSTIRELLCTGYVPLFDMLNTPEITARMTSEGTKNLLQLARPQSNTDKKVDEHTYSIATVQLQLERMNKERQVEMQQLAELAPSISDLKTELEDANEELDQATTEKAAMQRQVTRLQCELDQVKRERAAEKKQRASEKKRSRKNEGTVGARIKGNESDGDSLSATGIRSTAWSRRG